MNAFKLRLLLIVLLSGTGLTLIGLGKLGFRRIGSTSVPDPEYLQSPEDGQKDRLTGFTLTDQSGKKVRWEELNGQVRVVGFFFSSCPANCLQQNLAIRDLQRSYADKNVVFLCITCDPDIDSPERLREYATKLEALSPKWLFLTGGLPYIRRVANELFGVALDKKTHSESLIVADTQGRIQSTFEWSRLDKLAELRLLVDDLLRTSTDSL